MPIVFNRDDKDNTSATAIRRTSAASYQRLKKQYASKINFELCILQITSYLRTRGGSGLLDPYRVAERALFPDFGAVALNRDGNLELALYYWMLVMDTDTKIIGTNPSQKDVDAFMETKRQMFVRALVESQRGDNSGDSSFTVSNSAKVDYQDNGLAQDNTICQVGVTNKFAEKFVGLSALVVINDDLDGRILELAKAFVAEQCYAKKFPYATFVSADFDIEKAFSQEEILAIKNKIMSIMGIYGTDDGEGLLSATEINFLNSCLGERISSLSFYVNRYITKDVNGLKVTTPKVILLNEYEIVAMIKSSNQDYNDAVKKVTARREAAAVAIPVQFPSFSESKILAMLKCCLPKPNNRSRILNTVMSFETRSFDFDGALQLYKGILYDEMSVLFFRGMPKVASAIVPKSGHIFTEAEKQAIMAPQPDLPPAQSDTMRALRAEIRGI